MWLFINRICNFHQPKYVYDKLVIKCRLERWVFSFSKSKSKSSLATLKLVLIVVGKNSCGIALFPCDSTAFSFSSLSCKILIEHSQRVRVSSYETLLSALKLNSVKITALALPYYITYSSLNVSRASRLSIVFVQFLIQADNLLNHEVTQRQSYILYCIGCHSSEQPLTAAKERMFLPRFVSRLIRLSVFL